MKPLESPASWDDFFARYWRQQPGLFESPDPLLSVPEAMAAIHLAGQDVLRASRSANLRFYCDHERQTPTLVAGLFPQQDELDPAQYVERVCRSMVGHKLGLVLNDVERYCEPFRERVRKLTEPVCSRVQEKLLIRTLVFLGNYDYTPFGIHRDHLDTFMMPLLNSKSLYIWPRDAFDGDDNLGIHDVAPYLNGAHRYDMQPGETLFCPTGMWHIGHTTRPSLSLHVAFRNADWKPD